MSPSIYKLAARGRWIALLAVLLFAGLIFRLWWSLRSPAIVQELPFTRVESKQNSTHSNHGGVVAGDDASKHQQSNSNASTVHCPDMPGMEDILVVLKTGVTEALNKVPAQLDTVLRCTPNFVIVSDYEEVIGGVRTVDVLRNVSDHIKQSQAEFDLYNRVQRGGRVALRPEDYGSDFNSQYGRQGNPGWMLDKWKFLPMIDAVLERQPTAKWFVFIEADTYLFWENLLAWVSKHDPSQPKYLGCQTAIGDNVFAHGGSGFVLSNPAMRKVSEHRKTHMSELEELTVREWAGDSVLGRVLKDVGVSLTWSWPMSQGKQLWDLDCFSEAYSRRAWCHPVVTFHHMTPIEVYDMWAFDQQWLDSHRSGTNTVLFRDIFVNLVLPEIGGVRNNWDNLSEDEVKDDKSPDHKFTAEECRERCKGKSDCLQYTHHPDGRCLASRGTMQGEPKVNVTSGWMIDRITAKMDEFGKCETVEYVL